jgi:hypothetical protein
MRRFTVFLPLLLAACVPFLHRGGDEGSPPASFVRTTAELRATRVIEVREGLARADALRQATEVLEKRFVVEVSDPRAGYLMTAWQASAMRAGVPDLRYRVRFTARFVGDDWRTLRLRSEANWARGEEWEIGYDVAQLDTVSRALREQLSPRP